MQPLILDDLVPLAEYIGRRSEFFAVHGRYLDRYRRDPDGVWRFTRREFQTRYLGPPDLSAPPAPR